MTVPNPSRFSQTTVCARLIQGGQVVTGAAMHAVAHYKSKDTDLGVTTSGADGVGRLTFNIGGASAGLHRGGGRDDRRSRHQHQLYTVAACPDTNQGDSWQQSCYGGERPDYNLS
jgi:hypothetical protein